MKLKKNNLLKRDKFKVNSNKLKKNKKKNLNLLQKRSEDLSDESSSDIENFFQESSDTDNLLDINGDPKGKNLKSMSNNKVKHYPKDNLDLDEDSLEDSSDDVEDKENGIVDTNSDVDDDDVESSDKNGEDDSGDNESVDEDEINSHKQSLAKLRQSDPEFYKFLQENDKRLLDFNVSDSEDDGDDSEKYHKPDSKLEVASDESDFEEEKDDDDTEVDGPNKVVTLKMLKIWQAELQTDRSNETIGNVVKAFRAALLNVSSSEEQDPNAHYKVKGSAVFNAVVQLCVLDLGPAIRKFLGMRSGSRIPPHKCKRFVKLKSILKSYLSDLLKLMSGVTSSNIQTVLLKHLHYMSPMLTSYPTITKGLLKKLVHIWSTAAESVRVVSFLCILRLSTNQQASVLDYVLKSMHLAYVKNSKFVSTNTLSVINFMRRSLVEMFALDVNVSYQHVFLYIRQLAIHLRNAIVLKKTETLQAVYNWQYINSLRLWGNLFALTYDKQQMKQLVYPFVQVCLGTLKLLPTTQYFPLRFHVCQILIELTRDTGVFVPVLPFILEALTIFNFNKKHTKVSMKPLQFTTILRLSKSQLSENGFKDTCIDTVYGQILEYLSNNSSSIAFPDLTLFCVIQLKEFLKNCKMANYCKRIKQLLEKINQNAEFIQSERQKVGFTLSNTKQIEAWERTIKNNGTPLSTFYESWHKLISMKKRKQETGNDEIGDYNLPTIKKIKKNNVDGNKKESEQVTLFPSDSESEEDQEEADNGKVVFGKTKNSNNDGKEKKRGKRGGGKTNAKNNAEDIDMNVEVGDGEEDVVQEFNMNDW